MVLRTSWRSGVVLLAVLAGVPSVVAQAWGEVAGRVTEAGTGLPVIGATVVVNATNFGTAADGDGRYRLRLPEGRYALTVSAVGFAPRTDSISARRTAPAVHDVTLTLATSELGEAVVREQRETEAGVFTISPEEARRMPDPMAGDGLRAVKVLPGVTSNNETSNAYSVRGGGYNENLFFINGFEVYRPFRTRQGEQEGLGLVNTDVSDRLTLYAGGFPARYGGRLSSALDVQYGRPVGPLRAAAYASTLDAGASVRGGLLGDRLGLALAVRTARAQRFFAGQELEGQYAPDFRDVQGVATFALAPGHTVEAVGIAARHRFTLLPSQRRTTFGTYPNDIRTVAFRFTGEETDGYDVRFGGVRLANRLGPVLVEHDVSYFATDEFEQYDVTGNITVFRILDPNDDPNDPLNQLETGQASQRDVADNRVGVATLSGGGRYRLAAGRHAAEAGWTVRRLRFDDALHELSTIQGQDTLGATVDVTARALDDEATLQETQAALWLEDGWDVLSTPGRLLLTPGLRADYFSFNGEWTVSPRLGLRFGLSERTSLTAAAGLYHQAPTYRELRGEPAPGETILGALDRSLKSQRALLFVGGAEHFFPRSRFSLRGEAYYKRLDRLISYSVDNTSVLYSGANDSEGHAYGLDVQLRGEFVPGLESWLNYGFLVAREEFLPAFETEFNEGLRARPTDRRHNLALFVQDHIPGDETLTLHLRTLFGTGLPYTPPSRGESINNVDVQIPGQRHIVRYPEYFRFDMGATKRLALGRGPSGSSMGLELTAEVLNVFDQKNTVAYAWVDGGAGRYERVPTRLTPRTINVRLRLDL